MNDPPARAPDPFATLQARLDEEHAWPGVYTFKFIMKVELLERFLPILDGRRYHTRASAAGRHVSITAEILATSSHEVIAIYRKAAEIQGVISL